MVVVATEEEYKRAYARFPDEGFIITGVGALNIIRALNSINRDTQIINYGFVGSNTIPKGTEVTIGECRLYHPNYNYPEPEFKLKGEIPCYTSNDFVLSTDIKEPVVFDMELAYILALGFTNVKSIKIVSDNLSLTEYEEELKNV